jgi:hypothetical protein
MPQRTADMTKNKQQLDVGDVDDARCKLVECNEGRSSKATAGFREICKETIVECSLGGQQHRYECQFLLHLDHSPSRFIIVAIAIAIAIIVSVVGC